mmetsp:Transcript_18686/g.40096  ORF Transcript_18686/g.40096 Transcript_18686/m.40096 type:complete len:200 (+) Transcript_18686:174-773(+)
MPLAEGWKNDGGWSGNISGSSPLPKSRRIIRGGRAPRRRCFGALTVAVDGFRRVFTKRAASTTSNLPLPSTKRGTTRTRTRRSRWISRSWVAAAAAASTTILAAINSPTTLPPWVPRTTPHRRRPAQKTKTKPSTVPTPPPGSPLTSDPSPASADRGTPSPPKTVIPTWPPSSSRDTPAPTRRSTYTCAADSLSHLTWS